MSNSEDIKEMKSCLAFLLVIFGLLGLFIYIAESERLQNEKLRQHSTGNVIKIVEIMQTPTWIMIGKHTPEEERELKKPYPVTLAIIEVEDGSIFSQALSKQEIAYVVTGTTVNVSQIPGKTTWAVGDPKTWSNAPKPEAK